jgi:hypothetical protein
VYLADRGLADLGHRIRISLAGIGHNHFHVLLVGPAWAPVGGAPVLAAARATGATTNGEQWWSVVGEAVYFFAFGLLQYVSAEAADTIRQEAGAFHGAAAGIIPWRLPGGCGYYTIARGRRPVLELAGGRHVFTRDI